MNGSDKWERGILKKAKLKIDEFWWRKCVIGF